ncbi:MAG: hypothetical protein K2O14_02085, partial [Oscillospiraceae bacterium]|nr:hypothetical protein [Oscillospiraceae bacterium]
PPKVSPQSVRVKAPLSHNNSADKHIKSNKTNSYAKLSFTLPSRIFIIKLSNFFKKALAI